MPPASSSTPASTNPAWAAGIDAVIDAALADRRVVGAVVLVARGGQVAYRRAAGLADREAARPVREDTVFRYASLAKPIVTIAALRLVEEGRIGLDDPVTRFLPEFRPALADGTVPVITIRHLLTHTAGLTYSFFEPEGGPYDRAGVSGGLEQPGLSIEENLRRIASVPLSYAPGTAWGYSVAIDVLGAVLARAAGESLPAVVRSRVTGPLGLKDTGFDPPDRSRLAAAYADGVPEPVRMGAEHSIAFAPGMAGIRFALDRVFDPASYPSGGAGMIGTAGDFLVVLETLRRGGAPILTAETVRAMGTSQIGALPMPGTPGLSFGFGFAVVTDPAAAQTPLSVGTWRWGGVYGNSWFVDPSRDLTVVALTNTTIEGMAGRFTLDLREAVYAGLTAG